MAWLDYDGLLYFWQKIITPRENAGFAERPHRGHNTSRA